ncbi:hypothetical protein [Vibrio metschnikovii]|uniref:hypothetical protein n=1 Tax=Vibrio metschnikovii TaxID=28172 RepID=UPI001C2FD9AA|nr:hypothetical protein [Vibrio metschnikovii]
MMQPIVWGWLMLSSSVMDCSPYDGVEPSLSIRSVILIHQTVCDEWREANYTGLTLSVNRSEKADDYWTGWVADGVIKADPIVSSNYQQGYFGVSVWMPDELAEQEAEMTLEEWLKNHGVALSLAYGDKRNGLPRLRLDYRWHEMSQTDWFLQLEIPF